MQLYDKPRTALDIAKRVKGVAKDTIDFIPETVSWYATNAAVPRRNIYQLKPQRSLNEVASYVATRETFAGQPGALYNARSRVLNIEDPLVRTPALDFLDKLQGLSVPDQQLVMSWLQGNRDSNVGLYGQYQGTSVEDQRAQELVQGLGMSGQYEVGTEGLNIVGDTSGESLYIGLKQAFPQLQMTIDHDAIEGTLITVLKDINAAEGDAVYDAFKDNASAVRFADSFQAYAAGDISGKDFLKSSATAALGFAGDFGWKYAGIAGRKIGAEGIVEDIHNVGEELSQGFSDALVGYYDPNLGAQVPGLLNWDLNEKIANEHPEWDSSQIQAEADVQSVNRAETFGLIAAAAGTAFGVSAGMIGRRIKNITGVIAYSDDAVRAALPETFKPPGGTGLIDRAAELYRTPGRAAQKAFDEVAIRHLAVSPDDFFQEAMFGRLYNSGGKKLLSALSAAKKAHPGNLDGQVGFIRDLYKTTDIPDTLVRQMLDAPNVEAAKVAFVDYSKGIHGEAVIKGLTSKARAATKQLNRVTDEVVVGERNLKWNKDLARYNRLNDPEARAIRDSIMGPQTKGGTGMDASDWETLPENIKAQKIKAIEDEAELAALRKRLGFEPTTTDRFGRDFVPGQEPPPITEPRYTSIVSTPAGNFDLSSLPPVPEGRTRLFRGGDATGTWWTEDPSEAIQFAGNRDLTYVDMDASSLDWNKQLHPDSTMPAHWYNAHIGKNEGTKVTLKRAAPTGPRPDLPAEGTVVMMPTSEVSNLADPTLWDPETAQLRPPEFHETVQPMVHRLTNLNNTPDANDLLRRQRLETFTSTEDEAFGYHWGPAREFESFREHGVRPSTPEDAAMPESTPGQFPEASYWGSTGEEAWNLLPTKSARDSMVFRVSKDKLEGSPSGFGEELIAREPVQPQHVEYFGDDGNWHPLVGTRKVDEVSQAASEAASLTTRQAISKFSTFDAYPNLDENSTILREVQYWLGPEGSGDAARMVENPTDLGGGIKSVDVFEATGNYGKRFYYIENPDGRLGAKLTTDIRKYNDGHITENLANISLKSARGVAGKGRELLEGLLRIQDPSPDDLLGILQSNSISRKSAIAVHRLLKKMVQERTERVGKLTVREYNRLKADISANGIQEPLEVSVNPSTGEALASEGFHRWLIAKELGIEEVPVKIDYDEAVTGPQFLKAQNKPPIKVTDMQRIARERLKIQGLDEQIANTSPDVPMIHYPTYSHIRAVVRGTAVTRAERYMSKVLRVAQMGPGQFADIAKLVDELPSRPTLYVPGRSDNPADWVDRNTTTLSHTLRRAGVSPSDTQEALGRLSAQRTPQEFYEVLHKEIFGEGGLIDRNLRPDIKADPQLRGNLINLHGRTVETRTRSVVRTHVDVAGGTTSVDTPILGHQVGGEIVPLPSRPTEFINEVALPNVDDIIEATSLLRRVVRNAEKAKLGKVNAATPYNMAKLFMHVQTSVLKPLVMLVRLPAMGMRIQLEQSLRMTTAGFRPIRGMPEGMSLFPGGIPVPFSAKLHGIATGTELPTNVRVLSDLFGKDGWNMIDPDPRFKGRTQLPPNAEIGGFLDENTDHAPAETYPISTAELRENPTKITGQMLESHRKELEMAHNDWLDRKIAQTMDREKIKKYLEGSRRGRDFMETQMAPQLERTDAFVKGASFDEVIDTWIDNRIDYLRQITGGDGDVLDFIATGDIRSYGEVGDTMKFDHNGNQIAYEYANLRTDIDNIHVELQERYARGDVWNSTTSKQQYQALQEALRARQAKMRRLTDEWGDEFNITSIKSGDKRAFRQELRGRWENNPDTIPDRIMMEYGTFRRNPDVGLTEDLHRWAEASSSAMYRPFNALSYVDKHGTRGSLWTQQYERSMIKYRKFGYPEEQAKALAYSEAGNVTRDLMYDLNARTSVQRALKDLFWFAPATQEVLYTWLVKLPSTSYWPVGIVSMYSKFKLGKMILAQTGITEETPDGETILRVPGMARVVEMLTGKKVPDFVYGKATGLNIVSTGGGVPGLSTGGNFLLGRAALKWGGPFKALSDVFQPYGPEATLLPAPIIYLHEAIFGEAPPFEPLSHDYQKANWDRAQDQAIQYAYADLYDDGIKPPRIEDFGHDEDGRIVLTSDEENEYKAARKEYTDLLFETRNSYASGIAWTRAIGASIAPMALYTTSEDREAWDTFWNELTGGENGVTLGEDERQRINGYLKDHPNSLAFSVFTTKYGEKTRALPFKESLDDNFFDAYYTGEASTLTPKEYTLKLMATESRRFYQAKLDTALRDISPNLDPWELLRNANVRSNALTNYSEEWDRYKYLNPEAADLLDAQSRQWAETGAYPIKSFEAERLSNTLQLMKQITPMLTGEEDVRPSELREVQGQLSALYSGTGEFPEPTTATGKAMGWWYENVLSPYLDKTTVLYDGAEDLQTRGLDASGVYDQVRALSNTPPPTYKGQQVPTVEEYFWGNKTAGEREATKITWASRPITWLTDFQREQAGYNITPSGADFLNDVANFDEWFYNELDTRGITSQSKEWEEWQKFRDQRLTQTAEQRGPEAVRLLELNESAPIDRIVNQGYGTSNSNFESIANAAKYVRDTLEAEGYSPKSYSDRAMALKSWLYTEVANLASTDSTVRSLLDGMSISFPMDGGGYRQGVVLYEAVFFGNFNEDFIPEDLALLGG